ncbi:hypothetical protein HZH66_012754 [Vespula vulgaris]|uniref:Uncharacterized protein n=1 Tax=Vespula vulgaris TaxID=7454 RepID=A0A834MTS5_VESVU|nr:hypothetical protein HZH66_012754 [Vespula vulgaris]
MSSVHVYSCNLENPSNATQESWLGVGAEYAGGCSRMRPPRALPLGLPFPPIGSWMRVLEIGRRLGF